ncbi:hypothetical protein QZH41_002228 [Actinostola sp. cb2023]|nr:hypothetical protein QZH41_002228 [Actinostola sp. cb2023]
MSLGPSEWECIETLTLQQAVSKLSISRKTLLTNPVNDFVATLSSKCKDGSIALTTYRPKSITSLQSLFNLTVQEVETLLGITNSVIESFSLPQYVHAFLNASSIDLGIALNTMYDTTKKTLQQLFDSPIYELYGNVPYILRAAVKTPASQLRMSDADTFAILKLSPASSTIAQFKYAIKWVLPAIVKSKNKFENETLGSYLTAYSISDSAVGENTTLSVLLRASGFEVDTMKTIYKLTSAQLSVLELLHIIKELHKYCGLQLFKLKTKIFFNITATLVGILEISPTCKATNFYVEAKSETVVKLESVCPTVASLSTSLMRIVEECSGLSWRFNARIFGVNICDWPQMDVLNKKKLASLSDLSTDTVQQNTLEHLLTKANGIHTKNSPSYKTELTTYSGPMRTQLFSTFSTSKIEISQILGITEAAIDGYLLLKTVDIVQESLKVKYTINLSTTASTLGILLKDVKCLAPTEWNEMIPPLKNEIVASGSTQLSVTENSFKLLLQLGDISALKFSQLEVSWDSDFKRILTGKTFSENKTISTIQSIFNINQQSLLQETLLVFYNKHLNLTQAELSVLFGMRFSDLDVLTKFTFKEIPCSCKFSESHLMDQTLYTLLTGMVGHKDITLCRPIALLVAFRFLSINELTLKFTVNFNETETLLIVIQKLSDLPYEKISWGLNAQLSQWPVFASVSLETFANITSTNVTTLKSTPFHNVTEDVLSNKGRFAEQLQDFHNSLLAQASNLFVVPASGVFVVDSVFAKVTAIKGYYKGCTVDTFSEGSVVSKVSVYTNQKYSGSAKDMATYFRNGLNKTNGKTYLGSIKVKSNTLTAGFLKSYWWLVILLGIILLIIIIVIIVLVIKKPRLKSYGVDEDLPPMHHGSHSSLSYKNGDVFYKDKDGNVREGTEHVSMSPIEHQNPLYGREIPENVYDNSDSQWSHNIYALDNLGSDKPKDDEQPTKSNVDEATVQEDDAAQDHM